MESTKAIEFNSPEYHQFLKDYRISEGKQYKLIVYAGVFSPNRTYAIDELKRETLGETKELDLSDIITPYEDESYSKLDEALDDLDSEIPFLIFRNAHQLSGVYTGFTSSNVKYATPQQKYFLRKIKDLPFPVLLEFNDEDEPDKMVIRNADVVVLFKEPSSFIERIAWKIKQVKVHGSHLPSHRSV